MTALTRMPTSTLIAHCLSFDRDDEPIPDELLDTLLSQLDVQIEKAQRAVEAEFSKLALDTPVTVPENYPRAVKPLTPILEQAATDDAVQRAIEPSEIRETQISPERPSEEAESPVLAVQQRGVQEASIQEASAQEVAQVAQAAFEKPAPVYTPDPRCYCCREFWDPSYRKPTAKEALPYVSITNIPVYVFPPKPYPQPRVEEELPYVSITNIPIYVWPKQYNQ